MKLMGFKKIGMLQRMVIFDLLSFNWKPIIGPKHKGIKTQLIHRYKLGC